MTMQRLSISFFLLFFFASVVFSQASGYFPNTTGYSWIYDVSYLGDGDTVIPFSRHQEIDSVSALLTIDGKSAYEIMSRLENEIPNSTSYFSFDGNNALMYLPGLPSPLDTMISMPPAHWTTAFKFNAGFVLPWTIFEWDTTITIDTITFPAAFRIQGERVALNEEITVEAGTFTTARFKINEQVGTRFLGQFVPLFTLVDTIWIAPQLWIVKHTRSAATITFDTLSFSIPGIHKELLLASLPLSVKDQGQSPTHSLLDRNYPNPFNPTTSIRYTLPEQTTVQLSVYDIMGRHVGSIVNEVQNAGSHTVQWDALDLPGGVYFARLQTGRSTSLLKMLLIR